jgi:hypothetical protein
MIKFGSGGGLTPSSDAEFSLIQIQGSHGNRQTKESTWAKPIGGDLYKVKGPLHLIANLNREDVVRAHFFPDESLPVVVDVITRSGYRTLHIAFYKSVMLSEREEILKQIAKWQATHESPFAHFYTVEISPTGDFNSLREHLDYLKSKQKLLYEPDVTLDDLLRFQFIQ